MVGVFPQGDRGDRGLRGLSGSPGPVGPAGAKVGNPWFTHEQVWCLSRLNVNFEVKVKGVCQKAAKAFWQPVMVEECWGLRYNIIFDEWV